MERISDDDLVALIKSGDSRAEAMLYDRYWGFAKNFGAQMASIYKDLGFSADDFTNVAFTAVFIAIEKFNGYKNAFNKFWAIVAKNECMSFIHENTIGMEISGKPISMDYQKHDDGLTLHETLGELDNEIKNGIMKNEIVDYVMAENNSLSKDERVLAYYTIIQGYDYDDIVELTDWSKQKVYRVARKMKRKVSNFCKSRYFDK